MSHITTTQPYPNRRGVGRAVAAFSTAVALAASACTASPATPDTIDPAARTRLERIRATAYPIRYAFTYEPKTIQLLDCLVAPDPDLSGTVDTTAARLSIHPVNEPETVTVVTDTATFVERSAVEPTTAAGWYRVDAATPPAALNAARAALGPGLSSFALPPRMPTDPNRTVLATADAASRITFRGVGDVGGLAVEHLRIVTDPAKVADEIATSGGPSTSIAEPVSTLIDAAVDRDGRVVRLDIGTATGPPGTEERDTHRPSYIMTITSFGTASPDTAPPASDVTAFPSALPITRGTAPGCTVGIGPEHRAPTAGSP